MTQNVSQEKQYIAVAQARRALSTVNQDCGFHFYTAIGDYTGVTATNLQDLVKKCAQLVLAQLDSITNAGISRDG